MSRRMSWYDSWVNARSLLTGKERRVPAPPCSRGTLSVTLRGTDGETACLDGPIEVMYDVTNRRSYFTAEFPTSPTSAVWILHLPMFWRGLSASELVSNLRSSRFIGT